MTTNSRDSAASAHARAVGRRRMLAVTSGMVGAVAVGGLPGIARAVPNRSSSRRRQWIAGDHHIHSEFSVGYDNSTDPPTPTIGGDAIYPLAVNAAKARHFGLTWTVTTDHGGPLHSKLDAEQRYPSLLEARRSVPDVLQFYGMEFDTPAADHSTLIIPKVFNERDILFQLESGFAKRDPWPADPSYDTEQKMLEALRVMRQLPHKPVLFANHPGRSAPGLGIYGQDTPAEFRAWHDTAPEIARGFEGAPGHQAASVNPDGSIDPDGDRGGYGNFPTMGGFDQMTARLGGLWDSLLGEGRRWWITSTSDSHVHYTEGGADFWPGEYSKTYVHATTAYADILDALRNGRTFVTVGDLIDRLDLTARADDREATVGETLDLRGRKDVQIEVRIRQPDQPNAAGDRPKVSRVDLITGLITGKVADRTVDVNPTSTVAARYDAGDWTRDGEWIIVRHTLRNVDSSTYVRVRGTSTDELEPLPDPPGSNPWDDLWFYSNPVFLHR